jgi:hypothetical protein
MCKPKMVNQMVNSKTPKPNPNCAAFWFRMFAALAIALLGAAVAALAQSSPNEQLPAGALKEKAEAACLTCHEARIIVQQRLSKAAWTKELDKMTKWGAEVDPKDHDALIDYLATNFGPDQPAYAAPRSATESKSQAKTKK